MSHWPFVIAAYAVTLGGCVLLLGWAWARMRGAERRADEIIGR